MATDIQTPTVEVPAPLAALLHRRHVVTAADYHRVAEAGVFGPDSRLELLEGVIVEKLTRNPPHNLACDEAGVSLRVAVATRGMGSGDGGRCPPYRTLGSSPMTFTVTLDRDEDGVWIVECPATPGCVSQGLTRDEALENVKEAIRSCLEVRAERGLPLTIESRRVEVHV